MLAKRKGRVRLHDVGALEAGAARQEGEQPRLLHPDALHAGARDLERDALLGLGVRERVLGLDNLRKGAYANEAPEAVAAAEEPAPVPLERAAITPRQHQEPVVVICRALVCGGAASVLVRGGDDVLEPGRQRGHHRQRPPECRGPTVRALEKRLKRRAARAVVPRCAAPPRHLRRFLRWREKKRF